jgi:hypothetical protein
LKNLIPAPQELKPFLVCAPAINSPSPAAFKAQDTKQAHQAE